MHPLAVFALEYTFAFVCAGVALFRGGAGERLGAAWYAASLVGGLIANSLGLRSPTVHLIQDGIFAVGLLPLAVIYVSYWIGLVTLIAAALFGLEALYLVNDWRADTGYLLANNLMWLAVPTIYLTAGLVSHLQKRRRGDAPATKLHFA